MFGGIPERLRGVSGWMVGMDWGCGGGEGVTMFAGFWEEVDID